MHADRFGFQELKSVLISPFLNAIYTPLNLTFDCYQTFRAETVTKIIDIQRTSDACWQTSDVAVYFQYEQSNR